MSEKRWLIREYAYGYDDECYYVAGSAIAKVYENEAAARRRVRELELAFLRDDTVLSEHANFWNNSRSRMLAADRFVFEKTGKHLLSNWKSLEEAGDGNMDMDCGDDATLPNGMSDDDVLEFGRIAGIRAHDLIEFEHDATFHVLWDPREDEPVLDCDEAGEFLSYGESREAAAAIADERTRDYGWDDVELHGTADALSDSPALLEALVATTPSLAWNETGDELLVEDDQDPESINALNALLRTPFYTFREMTPEDIAGLERSMND